jgi:hypothetical protein
MGARERKRQQRIKSQVIARDGLVCCYCEKDLLLNEVTMEHIVPDSLRGSFNSTNLTVSCRACNNRRGNKPFFLYCKQYNFSNYKLQKYKKLYLNNLKIKVLNLAKEVCLQSDQAIPNELIKQACGILKTNQVDFLEFPLPEDFEINFDELCDRKKIKYCFEQLIRIIEAHSA